ncbi:MAG: TolC family protein, partial [Gemmataceae bacterium]|nr:TolC family protein [Gemmataceae bacterium]
MYSPLRLGLVVLIGFSWAVARAPAQERIAAAAGAQLSLEQCLTLALEKQPALAAARASLAAAETGYQSLNDIFLGRLLAPDLRIRREQACLAISIAFAGLQQAEWETRYAVRRTFYSVQYARMQKAVVDGAIEKIDEAQKKAKQLVDSGDPNLKVTQIDVDLLAINKEFVKTQQAAATVGILKAIAGLREAIGVGPDYPLEVAHEPLPGLVGELNKDELIAQARAHRAELQQAWTMNRITELEIAAQRRRFGSQSKTFAAGGDIHAKPIPQGVANGEYRPGAIGPEMPPFLVGPRRDRVQRAGDFNERAVAVVDKTENLVALEVEATYLKWFEAKQNVTNLAPTPKLARDVGDKVRKRFN